MKRKVIFSVLILLPLLCFAQKRSKLYTVSSEHNKSLKVATVKDLHLFIFRISSLNSFDISNKDTIKLVFEDNKSISLICNKTSSYHVSTTANGDYYNSAEANYTDFDATELKNRKIKTVYIAGMQFDNIKTEAINKALSD